MSNGELKVESELVKSQTERARVPILQLKCLAASWVVFS